ncbi:uncharacterized protein LOC142591035 [Dermacentor variabilis]|uniref:uncharacterized protein LOC142591035 n=1 Tax=Dermacentor variabilis TaxID=34621 RepID=UPI003F5C02EC
MALLLMIVLYTSKISLNTAYGNQNQEPPSLPVVSLQDILQFLHTQQEIHLQMIDEDDWIKSKCECVKSRFQATHSKGCKRTVECYKYVKVSYAPDTIKVLIGKDKMIRTFANRKYTRRVSLHLRCVEGC